MDTKSLLPRRSSLAQTRLGRFGAFTSLNLSLAIRPNSCPFDFLFFAYAGGLADVLDYGPDVFKRLLPDVLPIGILRQEPGIARGLVLGCGYPPRELMRPKRLERVLGTLEGWRIRTGARAIALAGQLPGLLSRRGLLRPPMVEGVFPTVYVIWSLMEHLMTRQGLAPAEATVGVVGIGYTGAELVRYLATRVGRVVAIDTSSAFAGRPLPPNVTYTSEHSPLRGCRVVVVLTGKGDQASKALEQLDDGAIVIDDAHPEMPADLVDFARQSKRGQVFKAVSSLAGTRLLPPLPGFEADWIPGCAIEAMVLSRYGHVGASQDEFNTLAHGMGFRPKVVHHRTRGPW